MTYPQIKPYLFKIGPLQVRWYGLMYLIGFVLSYLIVQKEVKRRKIAIKPEDVENLYVYLILSLVIGARAGYVLFYNLSWYINNPLSVFALWQGGMSFHGGFVGCLTGTYLFCRARKLDFIVISDIVSITVPIGLGLGRLGNFINGELYGRVTDVPWAMVFPGGGPMPRHPSQLYELLLEGVLSFVILWSLKDRIKKRGLTISMFIFLYGVFRFTVEFFREPDSQLGLFFGLISMGQILSSFMVTAGLSGLLIFGREKK
ncbi:prolipoprotein diacylglyceryl transferase [Candidatus Magnetomonas plexicatena]|uniref:prolipoprotein diacylglyceryl transferase n=1 Tax=Candidatus Magnetomonas plexicatena TaxID=2552947 RepID=UPI004032E13D